MRGRLAVATADRGFQGSFRWEQSGDALDLAIRGPIGAGAMQITGTPASLTLTSRGETRVLEDPETQLSELMGWWLPVGSLPAWLLGLPDPQFEARTETGVDGTVASLEQRLWRVAYESYQLAGASETDRGAVLVPRRIDLEHGDLRLRLTIEDWHAAAPH
jgi:outer membrane lipoprotein LolB